VSTVEVGRVGQQRHADVDSLALAHGYLKNITQKLDLAVYERLVACYRLLGEEA